MNRFHSIVLYDSSICVILSESSGSNSDGEFCSPLHVILISVYLFPVFVIFCSQEIKKLFISSDSKFFATVSFLPRNEMDQMTRTRLQSVHMLKADYAET